MFTGIVQTKGRVEAREGAKLKIAAPVAGVRTGDSVAVDGVCLTATSVARKENESLLEFDVSEETFQRTTLGDLTAGQEVNLEPPLRVGDPLGGHFVLGHVDATGKVASKEARESSVIMEFSIPMRLKNYLVPKGSVAVDGVSLTVVEVKEHSFTVSMIPYTAKNTTLGGKQPGDLVNLEMDILAKHVDRLLHGWRREPSDDLFEKKTLSWEELLREKEE
jgi:riboflavin synthase alpha subunit